MISVLTRVFAIMLCLWAGGSAAQPTITVFAAASLKTALDAVAEAFQQTSHVQISISYAGSSALARQIQNGAPAQVFISANSAWMDVLESEGLIEAGSRKDILGNRLVLIAAPGVSVPAPIEPGADLVDLLGQDRLATALVNAVPAGIYAKEALNTLGLWSDLQPKLAQTDNVRAALRLVALGETPFGIVYRSDALADQRVRIVAEFAAPLHSPIRYPAAIMSGQSDEEATSFLNFLSSAAALDLFRQNGFDIAPGAS